MLFTLSILLDAVQDATAKTISPSFSWNNIALYSLGITVLGGIILLIFRSGKVVQNIEHIDKDLTKLESDVKDIDNDMHEVKLQVGKISFIEQRLDSLWKSFFSVSKSPMQLNDRGLKILEDSGIKIIVEDKFTEIVQKVKNRNPKNAYEIQEFTQQIVEEYKSDLTLKNSLENGAFKSGADVSTVLLVGGIYIRDRVLKELGFNIDDIDKDAPKE